MNLQPMIPLFVVGPPLPQADQTPVIIEYGAIFDSSEDSSTMEWSDISEINVSMLKCQICRTGLLSRRDFHFRGKPVKICNYAKFQII